MANAGHIKWLLEGVGRWNVRRDQTDFTPDFEGDDIYVSFQSANKLDEEGYVPLSGINLKRANFRGARLHHKSGALGADLRDADLWGAELEEAEMENSRLEGACLVGAAFRGANMHASIFRRVEMASTGFVRTDLSECDFRGTEFNNAILQDAILWNTKLEGADLAFATLTGADLGSAQPWQAKLFEDRHGVSGSGEQPVAAKQISSVAV